jgi:hypothetical protein
MQTTHKLNTDIKHSSICIVLKNDPGKRLVLPLCGYLTYKTFSCNERCFRPHLKNGSSGQI